MLTDCLNGERLELARTLCSFSHPPLSLSLSFSLFLSLSSSLSLPLSLSSSLSTPLSFSLSLSLSPSLFLSLRVCTPSSPVREREGGRERERERERERCLELFLFLKGMTGALAPFSYLVFLKIWSGFFLSKLQQKQKLDFQINV